MMSKITITVEEDTGGGIKIGMQIFKDDLNSRAAIMAMVGYRALQKEGDKLERGETFGWGYLPDPATD